MRKTTKLTLTAMMLASFALAGCAQNVPSSDNPAPYTGPTATAEKDKGDLTGQEVPEDVYSIPESTATSKAEVEKESQEKWEATVLETDPEQVEKYAMTEVKEVFKNQDIAEGVRTGLADFRALQTIQNLNEKRDPSKDASIIRSFSENLDQGLIDGLVAEANEDNGLYGNLIHADSDGNIENQQGKKYKVVSGAPNIITENVYVFDADAGEKYGQMMVITGDIAFLWEVEGKQGVIIKGTFDVGVIPAEDGKWKTMNIRMNLKDWTIQDV